MRISDWSSDVCSSDLANNRPYGFVTGGNITSESYATFGQAALLQTWGTAARRHPVGGLGSIGEMLIEHNHGLGQGRGSNSVCSFNQAHLPHATRSEVRRVGKEFVRQCSSRWSPDYEKKNLSMFQLK